MFFLFIYLFMHIYKRSVNGKILTAYQIIDEGTEDVQLQADTRKKSLLQLWF